MDACRGQAATSVVSENEALKRRLLELDAERTRLATMAQEEREHLRPGDRVGFMGIGSGLNCMMLGLKW